MSPSAPSPFSRLLDWLQAERRDLWIAVIYSAAVGLLSLVVPVATQAVVNTIAFGTLLQPLVYLTLAVLVALGMSAVLQAMRFWVVELLQCRILVRVASTVVDRLLRARIEAFDREHGPELVNRFFDVVTVQKSAASLLVEGLSIFMQTVIGMILLGVYHPWLLAFDALLVVVIVIVLWPMGRGAISTSVEESKAKYALVAWLEEIARHPVTFKSERASRYARERANGLVTRYLKQRAGHFRILLRQKAGFLTLQAIASSLLLGVGGWLVIHRQLTLGQLVAAELIVSLVVSGFSKFGKQLETFYDLAAAVDKLGYLTDLPLERSGRAVPGAGEGPAAVALQGVTYTYPGKRPVLEQLNWTIPAGAKIGLTGLSGRGKSTLFEVLAGIREPQGVIELDGQDYRELKRAALRDQIALVREAEIFHGDVGDNVRFSNAPDTGMAIRMTLGQVGLLEEIQALPAGVATDLGTFGAPLSPGQAERLALARALFAKPRLLLIDEMIDRIDEEGERARILDVLFAADAPWTLVIASSREDVLERCGRVYEMWAGGVRETTAVGGNVG